MLYKPFVQKWFIIMLQLFNKWNNCLFTVKYLLAKVKLTINPPVNYESVTLTCDYLLLFADLHKSTFNQEGF